MPIEAYSQVLEKGESEGAQDRRQSPVERSAAKSQQEGLFLLMGIRTIQAAGSWVTIQTPSPVIFDLMYTEVKSNFLDNAIRPLSFTKTKISKEIEVHET